MPDHDEADRIHPVAESDTSPGSADVGDLAPSVFRCEEERRRLEQQLASLVAQSREQQASALADLRSAADQVATVTSRGEEALARAEERTRAALDAAQEARVEATNAHARAASFEDRARRAEAQLAAVLNSRSYRVARVVSSAAHPRQTLSARRGGRV